MGRAELQQEEDIEDAQFQATRLRWRQTLRTTIAILQHGDYSQQSLDEVMQMLGERRALDMYVATVPSTVNGRYPYSMRTNEVNVILS